MKGKKKELVRQLKEMILNGHAHATLEQALEKIPKKIRGTIPDHLPYSIWQIVEHIRITQWDILEFSRNPDHVSPKWPEEYWPEKKSPKDEAEWEQALEQIIMDRNDFIALLEEEEADLYTPFEHGDGQNLLREALLIADHTSYHTGELIVLRRLQGAWKK